MKVLSGITVVDIGVGMAAALVAKFLSELGARVVRVEPAGGDPFGAAYPAYGVWRRGAEFDSEAQRSPQRLEEILALADACVMGGEDHPEIVRRQDAAAISRRHPKLVVLDIEGYPAGTADAGHPATELLVQARAGLTWEHFTDRPLPMSFSPANYGAALRGLCALLAGLYEREGSGKGQVVSTSLLEGALVWVAGLWCDVANATPESRFAVPKDPFPLIFRCADGVYIHLVIGAVGSKYRMYQALGIDDPSVGPNDNSAPDPAAGPRNFFGQYDLIAEHVAKKPSRELLERIWALGLPAEPVLLPGECWDTPQVVHNRIINTDADGTRFVGQPLVLSLNAAERVGPHPTGTAPLSGVRVLDFGAFVAGPFASVILADLGAEVIKVETPAGDPNRGVFRSFASANRGKRAISIDLKSQEGLKITKALCVSSDVITNNFRAGVSARLGIDPASLHRLKPELVVLESPAYGSDGPLADRAGFDLVMQALCGHEYRAGGMGNDPLWNRTTMIDYTGGFLGAIGVLAALYHRARWGGGATVTSSLLGAGIYLMSGLVQRPDGVLEGGEPLNASRTGFDAFEALYQTSDGWIAVVVRTGEARAGLLSSIGVTQDVAAALNRLDDDVTDAIAHAIAKWTTAEAVVKLEAVGAWVEPCRFDVELATLRDASLAAARITQVSDHPHFGRTREFAGMMRFSRSTSGHPLRAPLKGESTHAVLGELGYSADEINSLSLRGVAT